MAPQSREGEEAFLGAMFQNLGRLLTEYYLPDEALQIRQQLGCTPATPATAAARDAAARRVLGLSLDDLGAGVARAWGLPETLQRCLRPPVGEVPTRAVDRHADQGLERLRWLARGANEMTDAMLAADGDAQAQALSRVAHAYAPALGLSVHDMLRCAQGARTQLSQMAQAMGLQVAPGAPAQRLLQPTAQATSEFQRTLAAATLPAHALQAQLTLGLQSGLASVQQAVASGALRLNEVLNLVLETLHQALDLRCVVFCLREPGSGQLVGRVALGADSAQTSAHFRIATRAALPTDLFAAVCTKGADLLVADARTVATRLPAWYRQHVSAPTFLLLPLMIKGVPVGHIYADKAVAGSIVLDDNHRVLLRGLRDQAVAALSKGGR